MIRAVLYDPSDQRLREGGVELIDEWERAPASQIWVAIENQPPETGYNHVENSPSFGCDI